MNNSTEGIFYVNDLINATITVDNEYELKDTYEIINKMKHIEVIKIN